MKLQSSQFAETWNPLRDRARPETPQEAESLASVLAPPSKAHLRRLARDRAAFRDLGNFPKLSAHAQLLAKQRANLALVMAHACPEGSRTRAPLSNYEPVRPVDFIEPQRVSEISHKAERDKLDAHLATLKARTVHELRKMVYVDYQEELPL